MKQIKLWGMTLAAAMLVIGASAQTKEEVGLKMKEAGELINNKKFVEAIPVLEEVIKMANNDVIEVEGKVIDVLPRNEYRIELENKLTVIARVSGKIRMNKIRILTGDTVVVELSPYDLTRGRITYRK